VQNEPFLKPPIYGKGRKLKRNKQINKISRRFAKQLKIINVMPF